MVSHADTPPRPQHVSLLPVAHTASSSTPPLAMWTVSLRPSVLEILAGRCRRRSNVSLCQRCHQRLERICTRGSRQLPIIILWRKLPRKVPQTTAWTLLCLQRSLTARRSQLGDELHFAEKGLLTFNEAIHRDEYSRCCSRTGFVGGHCLGLCCQVVQQNAQRIPGILDCNVRPAAVVSCLSTSQGSFAGVDS